AAQPARGEDSSRAELRLIHHRQGHIEVEIDEFVIGFHDGIHESAPACLTANKPAFLKKIKGLGYRAYCDLRLARYFPVGWQPITPPVPARRDHFLNRVR